MFNKYPKSFLRKVKQSLIELLSGDRKLGNCGLCMFLSHNTDEIDMSYDFVTEFQTLYRNIYIGDYGVMNRERVLLARKIIKEIQNYLEEKC